MTFTCCVIAVWLPKVRREKHKLEINHSPERLWPGQPHSVFSVWELAGKMERPNNIKVAMLTWDEMDGDAFCTSGEQYYDATHKRV